MSTNSIKIGDMVEVRLAITKTWHEREYVGRSAGGEGRFHTRALKPTDYLETWDNMRAIQPKPIMQVGDIIITNSTSAWTAFVDSGLLSFKRGIGGFLNNKRYAVEDYTAITKEELGQFLDLEDSSVLVVSTKYGNKEVGCE